MVNELLYLYKMSGSHNGVTEDLNLLGCSVT